MLFTLITLVCNSFYFGFAILSANWYVTVSLFTGGISYYLLEVSKIPLLACSEGPFKTFLETKVPVTKEKYYPTIWMWESRAQTVLGSFVRSLFAPRINYRREILNLADGGQVGLDWSDEGCSKNSPIVIILPGITGHSQVEYIRSLVSSIRQYKIRCCVFMNRGLGGVELKTPKTYCACKVEDLSEVVLHVKKQNPNVPCGLTGISMGGLLVGNYLATRQEEAKQCIVAAMLISPPWNVFVGTESIELPGLNMMLNKHLASGLCSLVKQYRGYFQELNVDEPVVMSSETIRQFDANFTAKIFGYKDVNDYYEHASIHEKISQIEIPTLCLSAADDPFQPLKGIPVDEANKSNNAAILVTSRGGHIGFLEGIIPYSNIGYMERVFFQYFKAILSDDNYILLNKPQ